MYCTTEEVIQFTGAKPQSFRLEKTDNDGLERLLEEWIIQCCGLIDSTATEHGTKRKKIFHLQ